MFYALIIFGEQPVGELSSREIVHRGTIFGDSLSGLPSGSGSRVLTINTGSIPSRAILKTLKLVSTYSAWYSA